MEKKRLPRSEEGVMIKKINLQNFFPKIRYLITETDFP